MMGRKQFYYLNLGIIRTLFILSIQYLFFLAFLNSPKKKLTK